MNAKKITRSYLQFILPLIAFGLFLSSCNQDDNFGERDLNSELRKGRQVGDLVVNASSVLLDRPSIEKIKTVGETLVVFESEPEQSSEIKDGAILVGARLNGGDFENIMGKVTSVKVINKEWHVQISPIKIEEFIYSGTISGTVYPMLYDESESRSKSQNDYPMVMIQDVKGFPDYEYLNDALNKTKATLPLPRIALDRTFSIGLPLPIVDLNSSVSLKAGFTPVIDYKIKFGWRGVEEFNITLLAQEILLDSHLKAYGGLKFELSTADMYSIPILPIPLGPTGLILSPVISAGPYAKLEAGSSLGDVKLFHIEGNVSYTLTNPLKQPNFDLHADSYDWSNIKWGGLGLSAEAGLKASMGIALKFLIGDIASAKASFKLGGELAVSSPDIGKINFKLNANLSSDAKIVLGVSPIAIKKAFPLVNWNPIIFEKGFGSKW